MERKEKIVGFMKEEAYKPLKKSELAMVLEVPKAGMEEFEYILSELTKEGIIIETKKHRFGLVEKMGLVSGIYQGCLLYTSEAETVRLH